MKGIRKLLKIISHRAFIITFLIFIQIFWLGLLFFRFTAYSQIASIGFKILSVIIALYVINRTDNPSVKLVWVLVILLFPLFGGLLYLYIGDKRMIRPLRKKLMPAISEAEQYLKSDGRIIEELKEQKSPAAGQVYYLEHWSGFPAWKDSKAEYYSSGELCFTQIYSELKKAKKYIFLEYFIVEEGIMWDTILDTLEEKAREGVDVRMIFDDVGSIFVLPWKYDEKLRARGIKCVVFNPYIPMVSTIFNNRDHRKIMVIDGKTAFTGGINLADEYINEKQKYGYWKDNGVKVTGKAVYNMTIMFLQMWNAFSKDKLSYANFLTEEISPVESEGIVLPYSDNPLDSEFVGENVYLNMINHASRYIYFFTPYLIIDNEMSTALILAAKRGVDVRIITPGIPDKKMVFLVTQSYYPQLIENGVKIFQYRPGFVHSKCAVCDDKIATVGTINLDYRSLYLHFENGIYLYGCKTVTDIKEDILNTLNDCTMITEEMCQKKLFFRILQGILRVFSPLL